MMRIRRIIFRAMGLFFAAAGVFILVQSFVSLVVQIGQRDWVTTTATITQTQERRKSTGSSMKRHGSRTRTVYDLHYEYDANGQCYEGMSADKVHYVPVGGTLPIKYNPDAPQESTDLLKVSFGTFFMNVLFSVLFIVLSLAVSGILADIRRKRSGS